MDRFYSFDPFYEWEQHEKKLREIIEENYQEIKDYYESRQVMNKLSEKELEIDLHFRNCENWNINFEKKGFNFSHQYGHNRINFVLKTSIDAFNIGHLEREGFIENISNCFKDILYKELCKIPYNFKIENVVFNLERDLRLYHYLFYIQVEFELCNTINLEIMQDLENELYNVVNKVKKALINLNLQLKEMERDRYRNF